MKNIQNIVRSDRFKINYGNIVNGLDLLEDINDAVIKVAFFDPQYRGVLDKLNYGNEGEERGKERSNLTQMDENTILRFISEIHRVTKPSGYLFLWIDKFHFCNDIKSWFTNTSYQLVDMIVWDKDTFGMGYRTRRTSEYLVVYQKEPIKAKTTWTDHGIPDVWKEKVVKNHPHSKPIELQKRLILATTSENDFVLDPASGGYSVFYCCMATKRNFIGGDIEFGCEFDETLFKNTIEDFL